MQQHTVIIQVAVRHFAVITADRARAIREEEAWLELWPIDLNRATTKIQQKPPPRRHLDFCRTRKVISRGQNYFFGQTAKCGEDIANHWRAITSGRFFSTAVLTLNFDPDFSKVIFSTDDEHLCQKSDFRYSRNYTSVTNERTSVPTNTLDDNTSWRS